MTKPSHKHTGHVQAQKPESAEKPSSAVEPSPVAPTPPTNEKARGGLWLALMIWAFAFGLFFVWLLLDLLFSFFRR
jgi:hypothetical protein